MNEDKLMGLVHQAAGDFGSILTGALVVLGDRLGLYRHLADAGRPLTSAERPPRGLRGTLRARMAQRAGSQRLCHIWDGRYALLRSRRRPSPMRPARHA